MSENEEFLLKEFAISLFQKVKHGDKEHKDWLEKEIYDYCNSFINDRKRTTISS